MVVNVNRMVLVASPVNVHRVTLDNVVKIVRSLSVSANHFPPSHLFIQAIDPCASQPCKNGGTCQPINGNGFQCVCPPGFTGVDCSISKFHMMINTLTFVAL